MWKHLETARLSPIPLSYPAVPIDCRSPISIFYQSVNSQGCWLPKSKQSDFDNNFKNEVSKLHNNEGCRNMNAEIDWKIYDKNNRVRISDALFVFAECMHFSLEKKLNRNLKTINEVIYYAMPYWDMLSNDEKEGWIRRAEAETQTHHKTTINKYREKSEYSREGKINQLYVKTGSVLNMEKSSSTFDAPKKQLTTGISFLLSERPFRRQTEQNTIIKIPKAFGRYFDKHKIKDDANKLSSPAYWWANLVNRNREIGLRRQCYSRKQSIKMLSITSPLRIKEPLTWGANGKSGDCDSRQPIIPISRL